ncbi:hypothetical protein AMTRI_Chr04g187650 [Amborella trichopoda]
MELELEWAWACVFAGVLCIMMGHLIKSVWLEPKRITEYFRAQGFEGPPYKILGIGNGVEIARLVNEARSVALPLDNNIMPVALPFYHLWSKLYGSSFLCWLGSKPVWCTDDPIAVKEVLMNKNGVIETTNLNPWIREALGRGILMLNGSDWERHRRIVIPAFGVDNLKEMVSRINESARNVIQRWAQKESTWDEFELDVFKEFKIFAADIIGTTSFGSDPGQAKRIIELLDEQIALAIADYSFVPGYRYLFLKRRWRSMKLNREIRKCMTELVEGRKKMAKRDNDLLGSMLEADRKEAGSGGLSTEEIIDECKTFFFAGHESTAVLLAWTFMLLGIHQEWQDRARAEVLKVLGTERIPSWSDVNKLTTVGMILNESLRLYPPAVAIVRKAVKDCKLGSICIPKDTQIFVPLLPMNHSETIWGDDAEKFDPNRFSEGSEKALGSFFPFGKGPRACVGQKLALLESKILMAMILQNFSFHLSQNYIHSPVVFITLYPQHGVPIILHALKR